MPIRMTGINSGMDTESIISELVKAKSVKKEKLVKSQTKLQWKQDAWKELNSKIYGFYTKSLSNMRLESDYSKKTTKLSDESVASIVTGGDAVEGIQELEITQLAKSGYLTGGKIANQAGTSVISNTMLSNLGLSGEQTFTVKFGNGESKELKFKETDTISDVVTQLKEAGLNASFDEKNQRLFVSSKESGAEANFELEKGSGDLLSKLGLDYANDVSKYNDEIAAINQGAGTDEEKARKIAAIREKIPHKITGVDAEIILNGATFTSKNNTFEINGLTITANKVTDAPVTVTTTQDTDGIYDMIKNFLKEYNTIINEMDALYNADSSKGYEPLTDEEKEAMSEKEVEKWEEKIKKSILRKDETVDKVAGAMKSIMMQGVTIDGTTMYLSDFGINTLGYFNAPENEKNSYHIDGDPDNTKTANNADKLKAMIASDPDKVVDFFSALSRNLYDKVGDLMKKTDYSSSFTLYDDVLMKKEYDDYKSQIANEEKRITAFEDRYYDKFSAMETALAKLQSKESAIAGLLNF